MKSNILSILFFLFCLTANSQTRELFVPLNLEKAYENGTRSYSGEPGQNYWQNSADYKMQINFDPESRQLKGRSTITYYNNSPDTLREMVIHTFPNIFKSGGARDRDVESSDIFEGVALNELKIGRDMIISDGKKQYDQQVYSEATYSSYSLITPIHPNGKTEVQVVWSYTLNKETHLRTGQTGENGYMIAYFFPRIGMYDDIDGWNRYAYTGNTEFYNNFGNYEVEITVPQNYLVWASGNLTNPSEVLRDKFYQRYKTARESNQKIAIVDSMDLGQGITRSEGENSWLYTAKNIPDFAFAVAKDYIWEAFTTNVNKGNDQKLTIHTVYDPQSKDFKKVNQFTKESIEFMTSVFPKVDFPYENHTVFNGLGMMEYPMMANDRSFEDLHRSRWLTHHETFHTYFPFLTGLNETKYAWLDEGLTMYGTNEYLRHIDSPLKDEIGFQGYFGKIGYDSDFPIFSVSKYLKNPTYFNNSYPKATGFFLVLREHLGEEKFTGFIQNFIRTWQGKHPTALDFLFLLNESTAEDLSWLINPWIFEFGYADLSFGTVKPAKEGYEIQIINKGNYPVPISLNVTYADGSTAKIAEPVSVWKESGREYLLLLKTQKKINNLKLNDISLIDANPKNNVLNVENK